jgi:hypothetical protein
MLFSEAPEYTVAMITTGRIILSDEPLKTIGPLGFAS